MWEVCVHPSIPALQASGEGTAAPPAPWRAVEQHPHGANWEGLTDVQGTALQLPEHPRDLLLSTAAPPARPALACVCTSAANSLERLGVPSPHLHSDPSSLLTQHKVQF